MSIIDLLTIIPVYIEVFSSSGSTNFSFFRMLRIFRALRILRMYKAFEKDNEEDEKATTLTGTTDSSGISKQIMVLVVTLFSMLFIGAGIVHSLNELETNAFKVDTDFDFVAAFYFLIVTCSTLGYGDIYPLTTVSRMITVILILGMVFAVSD